MGMLQKAKAKEEKAEEKKSKKRKHPSASASQQVPQGGEPDAGDDDADAGAAGPEPQDEGDASDAQGDGGGSDADQGESDDSQQPDDESQPDGGGPQGGQAQQTSDQGDTSDTDDGDDSQDQTPGQMGSAASDTGGGPASGPGLQQMPATPAMQEQYQRANQALYAALYQNDRIATAVLKNAKLSNPQFQIQGLTRIILLLVTQLQAKVKLMPPLIPIFAKDVFAHVLDLCEQVGGVKYTDAQMTAILGAVIEGTYRIFGQSKQQAGKLLHSVPRSKQQAALNSYHQMLATARSAAGSAPPGSAAPAGAQPQPGQVAGPAATAPAQAPPQAQPGGPAAAQPQPGGAPPAGAQEEAS